VFTERVLDDVGGIVKFDERRRLAGVEGCAE
jgi:hypothetical protein